MHLRSGAITLAACAALFGACGEGGQGSSGGSASVDPTPEALDGTPSQAFDPEDIERANDASPAVQAYCAEAVSEAQRVGCLSHVDESDLP